ncbi:MAG: hypothetical protein HKN70_04275 [Gammaproteobacteria bacterium]|nr:hypothetical protein [Gammaproteobacteria bacterium]
MSAITAGNAEAEQTTIDLDDFGESFVRLALALGEHDADYVDAYHGPESWRAEARNTGKDLETIIAEADSQASRLLSVPTGDAASDRRKTFLLKQFQSLRDRARIISGATLPFDQESQALYDAVAPAHPANYYSAFLSELEQMLPGGGPLHARVKNFRNDFVIPAEKLDEVFKTAIAECRRRTLEHIALPENENFVVEYVTDKAWSGYNWFQGNAQSLIQVNTDLPIVIERAIDLACHEGYPGHHVYNSLLEKNLLKDKGWQEFSVFPLFSPTGLIAEGSANYGIEMVFSDEERYEFEQRVLFPMAGLDANRVREYYRVEKLIGKLNYAGNDTARRYLDGQIDAAAAAVELQKYALMSPARAAQRVKFIDKYRSYVINYNLGKDMVSAWVERGTPTKEERWQRFETLLSQPTLPSQLQLD